MNQAVSSYDLTARALCEAEAHLRVAKHHLRVNLVQCDQAAIAEWSMEAVEWSNRVEAYREDLERQGFIMTDPKRWRMSA